MALAHINNEAWGWYRERQAQMLDVRSVQEFKTHGCLPEALHIPLEDLEQRMEELEHCRPIVVFDCGTGDRSEQAARLLSDKGFRQVLSAGDYDELQSTRPLRWG